MWFLPKSVVEGCIAALVFCVLATNAQAHGVRNDVRVVLTPVQVDGLIVELHQDLLAPQLVVSNHSGQALEILDDKARAFLRIGPRIAEGDFAAEAYHLSRVSGGADARRNTLSGKPRWAQLNVESSYGWFDPRIATGPLKIPHAIEQIGEEMPFAEWRIPARLGDKAIEFRGVFVYTPLPKGVALPVLIAGAVPAPGVLVQLSPGPTPAFFLRNDSQQTVAVLDTADRPFIKIGPDGVWADTGSPAWVASGANATMGRKGWQRISKARSHSWLDSRAAWRGALPKPVPASGRLGEWRIPLQIGAQRVELQGAYQWVTQRAPPPPRIPYRH